MFDDDGSECVTSDTFETRSFSAEIFLGGFSGFVGIVVFVVRSFSIELGCASEESGSGVEKISAMLSPSKTTGVTGSRTGKEVPFNKGGCAGSDGGVAKYSTSNSALKICYINICL